MKTFKFLVASMIIVSGLAVMAPAAEATRCYYPATTTLVQMCADANAGASDFGTSWRFTSSGWGSSTIPATVTMTASKTAGGSCAIISGSCSVPSSTNHIPKFASGPCNTVTVRTALTGAGTPSVSESTTACAGSGLVDPVGLALDAVSDVENIAGGALP